MLLQKVIEFSLNISTPKVSLNFKSFNNYHRISFLLLLLIVCRQFSLAQVNDTTYFPIGDDGSQLEDLIEDSEDEDFNDDTYNEFLETRNQSKLNINFATWEELDQLGLLSVVQIQNILFYREKFGDLKAPYELLGIEELTLAEIARILPYLSFNDTPDAPKPLKEQFRDGKHSIFLRYVQVLEEKKGFTPPDTSSDGSLTSRYLGIEPRFYARYRFQYGTDLSIGITADQDSGEPWKHPQQAIGVDYLSGHLYMKNRGFLKALVVGDYEVNLGQGLFMQQSYSTRKSTEVNKVAKKRLPFKPHTSSNEIKYARGLAAEFRFSEQWSAAIFGSARKVDGNAIFDTPELDDEASNISSIQTSGFHRTESELADKGAINEFMTGGTFAYSGKKVRIAGNASYIKMSLPLEKDDDPRNTYEFSGDKLVNAGIDYMYLNKSMSLFGDLAFSDNGGWAIINGGNFHLPSSLRLTLVHRYIAKDFHSLYGNAFTESSRPINEHGFYVGLTFSPFRYAKWSSFMDFYKHPYIKFGIDAPSGGMEIRSQFEYQPKRYMKFLVRGKYERKQENAVANDSQIDFLVPTTASGLRIHFEYSPSYSVTFKSRVDFAWYSDGVNTREKGILAYQDVNFKFRGFPLNLYVRYALFQTDTYDARLYAYENDLLYFVSIPAYSGKGSRYYLTAKYQMNRYISFWLKWAQTIYTDRDLISSGLEEIEKQCKI